MLGIKTRHHASGACRTPQWFDKMSVTSTGIGAMFSFQASGKLDLTSSDCVCVTVYMFDFCKCTLTNSPDSHHVLCKALKDF